MDKEIHDQPQAVADTLLGRTDARGRLVLDEVRIDESVLRSVDKIVVVACGTAAYAGHVAKYAIEHWCRIPVEVELAHEFRYRDPVVNERTLVVAVSQSGETMDTLMAVRHAREQGAKVLAIVNTHGSTIPRESDAVLYTHAGPEIAVASTKAFLAQITAAYLLGPVPRAAARQQVRRRGRRDPRRAARDAGQDPAGARPRRPRAGDRPLDGRTRTSVLFLGRHVGFPVAHGGCAQAQGARLHPRRGVRRGRAQARADRAHRAGAAGVRHRARRRAAATRCTRRSSRTSRRSAPAAPARS